MNTTGAAFQGELTVSQKILTSSAELEAAGQTPFTAETLIVRAWKNSPRTFGLKGFADEYPDSNRVLACLMGERGLVKRGWLVKVGQKLYTLSRQGKEEVRRINEASDEDEILPKRRALAKIKVPKTLESRLVNLYMTTAFRRYEEGMKREITYKDACKFWGLLETTSGSDVDMVINQVPQILEAVENLLIGDRIGLSNGQEVTEGDLKALRGVHSFLVQQFARHLAQQRDRRKYANGIR